MYMYVNIAARCVWVFRFSSLALSLFLLTLCYFIFICIFFFGRLEKYEAATRSVLDPKCHVVFFFYLPFFFIIPPYFLCTRRDRVQYSLAKAASKVLESKIAALSSSPAEYERWIFVPVFRRFCTALVIFIDALLCLLLVLMIGVFFYSLIHHLAIFHLTFYGIFRIFYCCI